MKNKSIVFGFILSLVFVCLIVNVCAQSNIDVGFCKIQGIEADGQAGGGSGDRIAVADNCYKNLLMQGKDEAICEEIPTTATKTGCENVTFDYCNNYHNDPCCPVEISTPEYTQGLKSDCYYGFAVAKLDTNLCSKSFSASGCIHDVRINSNNIIYWINAVGNQRFAISALIILLALIFFLFMQGKNKTYRNIYWTSFIVIFVTAICISSTSGFGSLVAGHKLSSAFVQFFRIGIGSGLLFYNLLFMPLFIFGWQKLMKKISKSKRKPISSAYVLIGGIIMSVLIMSLTVWTFYPGPFEGFEFLGFFMIAAIFAAIYIVMFSILFIANSKRV